MGDVEDKITSDQTYLSRPAMKHMRQAAHIDSFKSDMTSPPETAIQSSMIVRYDWCSVLSVPSPDRHWH